MKYLYSLIITLLIFGTANSQTSVVPDPGLTWGGYISWFENNSGAKGGYLGGGDWGIADVKTTITAAGDNTYADGALTLQPNFNTYADNVNGNADAQAFWTDGAGGGNKWLEATSKVDYAAAGVFTDGALTFNGTVASNTLDSNYSVVAFIKTLDPNAGYATIINETVTLGATGTKFSVSANGINQAHIVQVGFTMEGLNANPDNEAALGSIIVTPEAAGAATADPGSTWGGYISWFENNSGAKGGYLGGGDWGIADVKTTITAAGDNTYADGALTLQPNFNTYADNVNGNADAQAFWTDGAGGGNKWLEATSKVDYAAAGVFTDGALTFNGTVASNTLDSNYSVVAFIKTLDPNAGYATIINEAVTLGATGTTFAVSANGINQAHIVQIGFTMEGLNANPDNEAALGSIIVTPTDLGGDDGNNTPTYGTFNYTFSDAAEASDWPAVGGYTSMMTVQHLATGGNPGGVLSVAGSNTVDGAGAAFQVEENITFDYGDAAKAVLTVDAKIGDGGLVGGGVHIHFESTAGLKQEMDIQGKGLNDSTWTTFTLESDALSNASSGILRVMLEIAAGANVGAGGEILFDNIKLTLLDSSDNVLSINDIEDISFILYPNPAINQINIQSKSNIENLSIIDLMGRTVKQQIPNSNESSLDVSDLSKGIYLVKLNFGEKESVTRFIKK